MSGLFLAFFCGLGRSVGGEVRCVMESMGVPEFAEKIDGQLIIKNISMKVVRGYRLRLEDRNKMTIDQHHNNLEQHALC